MENGYLGEVIYDGGGNFLVLYKDRETCVSINRRFTKRIMEEVYGLKVLCSYVEVEKAKDNFKLDRARLYQKNRENEANESVTIPPTVLPFTQVDPQTSMPIVGEMRIYKKKDPDREIKAAGASMAGSQGDGEAMKMPIKPETEAEGKEQTYSGELTEVSAESAAKLRKYNEERRKPERKKKDELIFDEMVEEKGRSSLLAIIHIDGNNMGALFENALGDKRTYSDCVAELRRLSDVVQEVHIDKRIADIDALLKKRNEEEAEKEDRAAADIVSSQAEAGKKNGKRRAKHRRAVVAAGDDFTIICKAQDALAVTEEYLGKLWDDKRKDVKDAGNPRQWSACAGIAVFHSHAPFADAYRIAEACCDSAKGVMKKEGLENAELIDFEYLQSGIDMSLDKIRDFGNENISSRPWVFRADKKAAEKLMRSGTVYTWTSVPDDSASGKDKKALTLADVDAAFHKIARGNIKGLASAALDGEAAFRLELERMAAHSRNGENAGEKMLLREYKDYKKAGHEKEFRALVYDYVICRDLWFPGDSGEAEIRRTAAKERAKNE